MTNTEKQAIISALSNGTVEVTFKKVGTEEIRVMPCTTKASILESHGIKTEVKSQSSENDQIVSFALDKESWRSFLASTVISWKVLT
jgi:hypothetical protein